jgi:RNA polymerase sigma-70 factor, ECF subfamily
MILPSLPAAPAPVSEPDAGEIRAAVRRFIGARVNSAAVADDLTQEVLLKVLQRLPQVRDPRRLMGWVIQIARNTVIDHYRSRRAAEPLTETDGAELPETAAPAPNEEGRLRDSLARYVRSVVQQLPPVYREAIELTEYDGLSQVELAARLGISISGAKSRVQRARVKVRETIERCCHFEVDRYGTVLGYEPRVRSCTCARKPRAASSR